MTIPLLSVLMTVYNGKPWVREAVESVLNQTLTDFEFIVVNDGSTDGTETILDQWRDSRLKVIHQPRAGQTPALNMALRLSTAPLLARMDADDVALPERFACQVAFLEAHSEVGLLGTGCREISPAGDILRTVTPPIDDRDIRRLLIRSNPFIHTSVVFRRKVLEATEGYDERFAVAQDYDLWLRMSRVTRMANLPEPLVLRRLAPGQLSSARDTTRLRDEVVAKCRALRSGAYPAWCAVFLLKPVCALALPAGIRRLIRHMLSGARSINAAISSC